MEPDFLESGVDFARPNAARMYDYFLGGAHNFAVDRELGAQVEARMPSIRRWAAGNRAFLARVVNYCLDQGVRQFLDLGSGIPATGHVHEIARARAPETRVAYVDFEPTAVAYSTELLVDVDGVTVTRADVRDPASVLGAPSVAATLDFTAPVAVLAVALVHFISDGEDPAGVLAAYRRTLVPGSFLAVTHGSTDYDDADLAEQMANATELYRDSATPAWLRSRERIHELLAHCSLVEPGLVDINRWRHDGPELGNYAALVPVTTDPGTPAGPIGPRPPVT